MGQHVTVAGGWPVVDVNTTHGMDTIDCPGVVRAAAARRVERSTVAAWRVVPSDRGVAVEEQDVSMGLEAALVALEAQFAEFNRRLSAVVGAAKKAKAVIGRGVVREIENSMGSLENASREVAVAASALRSSWQFDAEDWFESGAYAQELLALAAEQGLRVFESDERILCYPTIVQVSPNDSSVSIDKKKERGVRPSLVVAHLRTLAEREPRFRPEAFLETLGAAYDLVAASRGLRSGAPAKLVDVYAVLTLMPGSARHYTKAEFTRDIYFLDQSGVVETRKGRRMSLPASALTRSTGAVLRTVTKSGQAKDYAGISFEEVQA